MKSATANANRSTSLESFRAIGIKISGGGTRCGFDDRRGRGGSRSPPGAAKKGPQSHLNHRIGLDLSRHTQIPLTYSRATVLDRPTFADIERGVRTGETGTWLQSRHQELLRGSWVGLRRCSLASRWRCLRLRIQPAPPTCTFRGLRCRRRSSRRRSPGPASMSAPT
jgi:hypothetical protein